MRCAFQTFLPFSSSFSPALPCRTTVHQQPWRDGPEQKAGMQARAAPRCELAVHKLGTSDLQVTEVCLGTMVWGTQSNAEEAEAQLDYGLKERGVNFLDCAELYPVPIELKPPGVTELIIGDYLHKQGPAFRDKVVVATKVSGFIPGNTLIPAARLRDDIDLDSGAPLPPRSGTCLSRDQIIAACDASLRRMKTDYIDLYQIHWPERYVPLFGRRTYDIKNERDGTPLMETLLTFKELLDSGKIRAYGLSNETTYGVAEFVHMADELGMPRPCTIQNAFSMVNRSFESELAEACSPSHYNVSLLPYSILAAGALSGKYLDKMRPDGTTSDESLKNSRLVKYPEYMLRYKTENVTDAIRKYDKIAKSCGLSLAVLAQAFCKTRFFIQSSIVGSTSVEQLKENIDAFEVDLDEAVLTEIDKVHNANKDVSLMS